MAKQSIFIKKQDLLILIIFPVLSTAISLALKTNFLVTSLLFFAVPSLYFAARNPRIFLKTSIFSLIFSVPITFIFDYLLVVDNAWHIVTTVFPYRLFNVVALEQFVFSFFCIYFMISVYEQFFDRKNRYSKNKPLPQLMRIFAAVTFLIVSIIIGLIFTKPSLLIIPYAYTILGVTICAIPAVMFLHRYPHLFIRFVKIAIYFLLLALLVEYVGLKLNHWNFPGQNYLSKINFFGFSIPLEEFLFYFVLSTPGVLSYYEFFDDDRK